MMNVSQIEQLIPNRAPWLWIDEVISVDEREIHARKHLSETLPVFQGHYPDFPLLPGVLQCEAALEASAVLIAHLGVSTVGRIPVAARMNNVKFKRMVAPGETLDIFVQLQDRLQDTFYLRGRVEVDGAACTTLDFVTTATEHPAAQQSAT